MPNLTGKSLGRYQIIEQLGEGGMANVYKAYDTRLETEVAVKVIRTEDLSARVLERALKRFEREAKALAKLNHPNIVKVIDYGEYDGNPYLVMPYLSGGTLKHKLNGQQIPWRTAIRMLLPIARALDYAHRQGMIHRDVKPSNILITEDGDPLLTDFGIAKIIDEDSTMDLTGTGATVGTPEYMAPEQVVSKSVDHRADIYALGVVLYEMMTGRKLYTADTPMAVLFKHASDPLPRPTQYVRDLPNRAEQILLKVLAKKPEDRYQSMADFVDALESLVSGSVKPSRAETPIIRKKDSPPEKLPDKPVPRAMMDEKKGKRMTPGWLWLGGGLLGAAIVGSALFFATSRGIFNTGSTPAEPPAATETSVPTQAPTFEVGSAWTRPADDMVMMYVPAGEFTMGSNTHMDEQPVHMVSLDAFWMDQTEVTNAMHQLCVRANVCQPPLNTSSATYDMYYWNLKYDNYPVVYVNWNDAKTYCEWAGARLPTEAEWEKAARGTDGKSYPWGETANCLYTNYMGCTGDTTPVRSHSYDKSSYGIYDLAGNVSEWLADWYDAGYYAHSPAANPPGAASGHYRVLRGGAWYLGEDDIRSANRSGKDPTFRFNGLGFRCVRPAK